MNWYILVLIIDVPAVHLSIFYLGSDIQGYSFWESRKIKGSRALEIKSERSSIERKLSSFIFLFCTKL